jgi:hypothetical protein
MENRRMERLRNCQRRPKVEVCALEERTPNPVIIGTSLESPAAVNARIC